MKKIVQIVVAIAIIAMSCVCLAACNGVIVSEGTVIAKLAVGKNGKGLEQYGLVYVDEGYYIVVSDGENYQVFQARSENVWNETALDADWTYEAVHWIIWVGDKK